MEKSGIVVATKCCYSALLHDMVYLNVKIFSKKKKNGVSGQEWSVVELVRRVAREKVKRIHNG